MPVRMMPDSGGEWHAHLGPIKTAFVPGPKRTIRKRSKRTPKTTLPPNAIVLDCIKELQAFAAWIRRENRTRPTILKALDARVRYLQGVATQTVDVSGDSATMQAGGVPRRGQDLPDATLVRSASDMTSAALEMQHAGLTSSANPRILR